MNRIPTKSRLSRWASLFAWVAIDLATVALFIVGIVLMLSGLFPGLLVVLS